ncbi:GAP family protein [Janibacter sp. GXQ6167]|uniref:GAP family protein n=1 Tax=Janibacter sp. GXQ6167 TaxID=3240791 RepID=UPI003524380F
MGRLLLTLLPVALAAGVSPMMLSEQLLLLTSRDGARRSRAYAAGMATVLLGLSVVVLTIGRSLSLPKAPTLSAGLDIALGTALIILALVLRTHTPKPRPHRAPSSDSSSGVGAAYGFGAFSMLTNFTSLPLIVVASKDIAASGVSPFGVVLALVLLLLGGCLPAWAPLVLNRTPAGARALRAVAHGFDAHGRTLVAIAVAGVGLLFVAKGTVGVL